MGLQEVQDYRNSQKCRLYAPCIQKRVEFWILDFILVEQDSANLLWCEQEYQNWVKLQTFLLRKGQRLHKSITVVMFFRL